MSTEIVRYDLGVRAYEPVHRLQQELVAMRRIGEIGDTLLLLEHEPVITLGRRADPTHILANSATLSRLGITVCATERGGDVTYHGPGQLVAYPTLALHDYGLGAGDYMHMLEEVVIATLAELGLHATRRHKLIGVWVGPNKICAMGVRIRRGITMHGLALNIAPRMDHWELIVPCGIRDGGVTSLAGELPETPSTAFVANILTAHLSAALGVRVIQGDPGSLPDLDAEAEGALAPA